MNITEQTKAAILAALKARLLDLAAQIGDTADKGAFEAAEALAKEAQAVRAAHDAMNCDEPHTQDDRVVVLNMLSKMFDRSPFAYEVKDHHHKVALTMSLKKKPQLASADPTAQKVVFYFGEQGELLNVDQENR